MGLIGHDGGGGPARATAAAGLVAAALALLPAALPVGAEPARRDLVSAPFLVLQHPDRGDAPRP